VAQHRPQPVQHRDADVRLCNAWDVLKRNVLPSVSDAGVLSVVAMHVAW